MGLRIVTLIPTRFGLEDDTAAAWAQLADALHEGGHEVIGPIPIAGTYIDQVRAELVCAGLKSPADTMLLLDDDVQLTSPSDILKALEALEEGDLDVLSIPYLDRRTGQFYIAADVETIRRIGGLEVIEATATTLGMTIVRRRVFERLYEHYPRLRYESDSIDGEACAVFQPSVMAAGDLPDVRTTRKRLYVSEDKMFCIRAREVGIKLHAALGIETSHRGLVGMLAR